MKNKKIIVAAGLIIILAGMTIYFVADYNNKPANTNKDIIIHNNIIGFNALEKIIDRQYEDANLPDRKICLFINMDNFECHSCYEQFLKIVDLINLKYKKNAKSVLILFPENKEEGSFQKIKLKKWLEINDFSYNFFVLKNETEDLSAKRTCVILKKNYNDIVEFNIPMSNYDLDRLKKLI